MTGTSSRAPVLLAALFISICGLSCSLFVSDYDFEEGRRHGYDPVKTANDQRIVRQILDTNGLNMIEVSEVARTDTAFDRVISLDLHSRNIRVIPATLCDLDFIENLDLSHNQITSLPDSVVTMRITRYLYTVAGGPCGDNWSGCDDYPVYGNGLNIRYNRLCAESQAIITWLDGRDPGWGTTQTCP